MTMPTITDYLKYADLQMAAEAFLVNDNGTLKDNIQGALLAGNGHSSRFTQQPKGSETFDFLST
jgi:hypothetical protein